MAFWLGALGVSFLYLVWLVWFDVRHHRPYVALFAAILAAVYLGVTVTVAASPWVSLPLWPTIVAFVAVEVIVRSSHWISTLRDVTTVHPHYPVEVP